MSAVEKLRITEEFLMGVDVTLVEVIINKELKSGKIIGASQDGNKKWVLLLTTIYPVVSTISPIIIYQGKSGDLRNTCTNNID